MDYQPSTRSQPGYKRYVFILLIVAIAAVAFGIATRTNATAQLRIIAENSAIPTVAVITPVISKDSGDLVLPGNLEALNSAAIFAQTSGYIKTWSVDIGDNVKAGQVLAILDAPELEHQLAQARADYNSALAQEKLAKSTSKRIGSLVNSGAVTTQRIEETASDAAAKSAMSSASLANIKRLEAQQGFTRLIAPFDGIVSSRTAEIGDLVVSGVAGSKPLFTISDVSHIRIHVRVPQSYAAKVIPGLKASLLLPEYPNRKFEASVTRSARAVDMESGSVLVELQADNTDGALMPGAYVQVAFQLGDDGSKIRIPGSAVLYRDDKPTVAILSQDNHVTLTPISIGRDEGKFVEITTGITANDRIVDTPPDGLHTADLVKPAVTVKGSSN